MYPRTIKPHTAMLQLMEHQMQELGLSSIGLSRQCGISNAMMILIRAGRRPTIAQASIISRILDIDWTLCQAWATTSGTSNHDIDLQIEKLTLEIKGLKLLRELK